MELLAPVGSPAAFEAALEAGADAVYAGAPGCHARALSRDFSSRELQGIIGVAHGEGLKVYLAMNSLVKEDELGAVIDALALYEELKVDALIVQDPAVALLARRHFPALKLHASTLMLANNSISVRHLLQTGFSRVVLPRELTIDEIGRIHRATGAELEVFVHGAMCFSYSGLCLFSTMHGGKSSLRGRCVQPCRRRYGVKTMRRPARRGRGRKGGRGGYLFSMNDLEGIGLLAKLRKAGVCSLKVEGRMKAAGYVERVIRAYRMVLDSLEGNAEEQRNVLERARALLSESMGRRTTPGYFRSVPPRGVITHHHGGGSGLFLGRARAVPGEGDGRSMTIVLLLKNRVECGDRIRLHPEGGDSGSSFTLRGIWSGGRRVFRAGPGSRVRLEVAGAMGGARLSGRISVYKVDLRSRRGGGRLMKRLISGRKKVDTAASRRRGAAVRRIVLRNRSQPPPAASRSGGSGKGRGRPAAVSWWLKVERPLHALARFPLRPERIVIELRRETMAEFKGMGNRLRRVRPRITWSLPPVVSQAELSFYREAVETLLRDGFNRWQLGHAGQVSLFHPHRGDGKRLDLSGDYTFNVLNSQSLRRVRELGFDSVQFCVESDRSNLAAALAARPRRLRVGMCVYGRLPLFTSRAAQDHLTDGLVAVSPRGEEFVVRRDRELVRVYGDRPFSLLAHVADLERLGLDFFLVDARGASLQRVTGEVRRELFEGGGGRIHAGNYRGILQ